MTYDRYDNRRGREPRSRFFGDDRQRDRFERERFDRDDRDERGFFERAGDEVASWFGDDDAERRRRMDRQEDDFRRPSMRDEEFSSYERQAKFRDEGYRRPYTGSRMGRQDSGGGSGYRPITGDYGRSQFSDRSRFDRSNRDFSGSASGNTDPHYGEWRQRQIDDLDRDYDDYRRENQSKFDSDFSQWRTTRQSKRQLLGQVREHMQVFGSDDQEVGTVDKVRGDRIILTKNESSDGRHHSLNCSLVNRVEGDRVILDKPAEEAKRQFGDDMRDRALFERDDQQEAGPHMLNRSFSGTY